MKKGSIVTIGVFDGVHLGHRAVILSVVRRARRLRLESVVVTFDPHPRKVLRPGAKTPMLMSLAHRICLISELGVDRIVVISFTKALARLSAEEFVSRVLVHDLGAREIHVSGNFYFGRGARSGTGALAGIAARSGVRTRVVAPVKIAGRVVSSSRIRSLVVIGRLDGAARLLGRPFSILGTVVKGLGRGRFIGFPTANIDPHHEAIPPSGVYAVRVLHKGRVYRGVLNIGVRPSFFCKDTRTYEKTIEVYILDFAGDIYGEDLEVRFVRRIRTERRFATPEALAARIAVDSAIARRIILK